jgi:hypothetical protein
MAALQQTCPSIGDRADPGRQHHHPLVPLERPAIAAEACSRSLSSPPRSTALPSASSLLALALPGMLAVAALPALSVWIRTR